MGKVRKESSSKAKDKGVLRPSSSKGTKSKPTSTKSSSISKKGKESLRAAVASSGKSKVTTGKPTTVLKPSSNHRPRVLSDEESQDDSEVEDEDEEEEDPDHQLGLRPTLRVVSKATVKKTWKPISVKTRTHIQSLVSSLFPMNDRLSDLPVPPAGKDRANYSQLAVRNRELEAMLVPDLEHIRDLELRLEQEQILAAQDEEQLENFREKKRALDIRTNQLHRAKLHPLLRERDNSLQTAITHLCESEKDFSHLSAADQRLMAMMPLSRDEDFSQADVRDTMYNVRKEKPPDKV
ncbi:hypothetical protein BGX21_000269 [Mortierella sp. AD011]|nr:hypothetical protein BGX21_000269 [Mortierella sp. AD011]